VGENNKTFCTIKKEPDKDSLLQFYNYLEVKTLLLNTNAKTVSTSVIAPVARNTLPIFSPLCMTNKKEPVMTKNIPVNKNK
jgi:hypothetical protein